MRRSRLQRFQRLPGAVALLAVASVTAACSSSGTPLARARTTTTLAAPTATVKIGFIGALSGASGRLGVEVQNGEKLAISQFDAVNPPVNAALDSFDAAGGPSQARAGAMRLAADKVVAVVGPLSDQEAGTAEPVFEHAGIPTITVSAAEVSLAQHRWRFFHRLIPDDSVQGKDAGAYLVNALHAGTVALLDDSTTAARELAGSTGQGATAAGARVVYAAHLDGRNPDLASAAGRILAASPDAVFFGGSPSEAAGLLVRLRSGGYSGKFVLGGSDGAGPAREAGASAEGSYVLCACAGTLEDAQAQTFNAAYLAQFGSGPGPYAAEAYDATNAILSAIQHGHLSPGAVNEFLASVDYAGITRTVRFQTDGNWSGDNVYVYRVQSGQLTEVGPTG